MICHAFFYSNLNNESMTSFASTNYTLRFLDYVLNQLEVKKRKKKKKKVPELQVLL